MNVQANANKLLSSSFCFFVFWLVSWFWLAPRKMSKNWIMFKSVPARKNRRKHSSFNFNLFFDDSWIWLMDMTHELVRWKIRYGLLMNDLIDIDHALKSNVRHSLGISVATPVRPVWSQITASSLYSHLLNKPLQIYFRNPGFEIIQLSLISHRCLQQRSLQYRCQQYQCLQQRCMSHTHCLTLFERYFMENLSNLVQLSLFS